MKYLHFYVVILNIIWIIGDNTDFDFADTRGFSNNIVSALCNAYEAQKFERVLAPSEEVRKEILKCIWVFTSRINLQNGYWGTSCSRTEDLPPDFGLLTSNDTDEENEVNPGISGDDDGTGRSGIPPGEHNKTRWPHAVMVYEMDKTFSAKDIAYIALSFFDLRVLTGFCLNFRKKLFFDNDYVTIVTAASGCRSSVGRRGGRQELILAPRCMFPSIITHELIHSWGFYHEHCRVDRDKYVKVLWDNVEKGRDVNFQIQNESNAYGIDYDYRSIMHYAKNYFSINSSNTLEPRDPNNKSPFGGPIMTSFDRLKLARMYCPVNN